MKKNILALLTLISFTTAFAQDPIKNFSFENWSLDGNNKERPDDWAVTAQHVNADAVKKHSSGSEGSTALYVGSFDDAGTIEGGEAILNGGTLTSVPASLSFDYIVQNISNNLNGVEVTISFTDANGGFLDLVSWESERGKNNASFKSGFINFDKTKIANAARYRIFIIFFNDGGNTDEYAVVDNLKFSNTPGMNVSVSEVKSTTVSLYPNPTSGIINYTLQEETKLSKIVVTSMDGKETVFTPNFTNSINISSLSTGTYTVSFLNEQNAIIGRNKVVLTK